MAQIDTSIYRGSYGPTMAQALGGTANTLRSIKQDNLADLAMKQQEFNYQQSVIEAQRKEQERKRQEEEFKRQKMLREQEEAKRQEFLAQYQTQQMEDEEQLSPEQLQGIYANVYPEKFAEMQMKNMSNPLAMMEYERKMENQKMAAERLKMQKEEAKRRAKKDKFMEGYRTKNLAWKQKNYDRSVYEYDTTLAEKIRDQDWDESTKEREQLELHQKIAPVIQRFKNPDKKLDIIEVRKINEGTAATGNLLALTGDLTSQIDKHGLEKIKGPNKARMESTVRAVATSLNNAMFVNSGVMSQGELENLKEMVGDPTSIWDLSASEVKARMESLQKFVKSKYINSLDAYGVDGNKAYNAINLKTKGFFKKNAMNNAVTLTPEQESWLD